MLKGCLHVTIVTDFRKMMIALIAAYYSFNIQYSKEVDNTLLFIERHMLDITTGQRMVAPANSPLALSTQVLMVYHLKTRRCV